MLLFSSICEPGLVKTIVCDLRLLFDCVAWSNDHPMHTVRYTCSCGSQ